MFSGCRDMKIKFNVVPYLYGICCLALTILLSACEPLPEPPLRIGTNLWAGYEPLYLARDLGYYRDTQIHLVEMNSASEVIHSLRSGTLEGAALTLDEALTLQADNFDLKVILVMDFSNGADVLLAKPDIETLADLSGKRIAVEYTAVGAILLDAALASAELTVSDIEVISCSLDNHLNCFALYDAVVTFEPIRTKLLAQGARQLFDSSKIPGRIVDVLVVHKETINTHTRSLKNLLLGYFKARKYLAAEPEEAAKLMALRQGISAAEVLASYDGIILFELEENRKLLNNNPENLQNIVTDLSKYMLDRQLLRKAPNIDNISDARFLPPGNTQ